MKEQELRQHATCSLCRKKILEDGIPFFYRVTIEQFEIDLQAVRRKSGLGMMLNGYLAQVMGPDEDMAKPVNEINTLAVCAMCASDERQHRTSVAALAEIGSTVQP